MRVPLSTKVLPNELNTSEAKTQIGVHMDQLTAFTEANFV